MASMSLQAAFDQARQWLESNDLSRAIGLAQYILERYPDNLDAYRILGEAYLANRQLDRAQDAFERVLRSDPENIPAHVGLGITFERQGRLDRAIPEFEQALEIKPDMPELRSQLLRLYTEAWGSEHAQLRLSRAGLARLYAKGHMLPQAINEFRQVVADQPDRFDAQVAMAEALWRDGQEDAAIDLCRTILAKRPESLKANLILGYLEMAGGQPEGERAWESARRMDPYQVVAHAVFDTLPPEGSDEPMIDEWDEAAWRKRQAEEQERIAATRPMEAVTPVAIPVPADNGGNGSRFVPPPPPTPRSAPAASSDDFLANLLAINTAPPAPAPSSVVEEDLDLDLDMAPFSLDDLEGSPTAPPAAQQPAAEPPSVEDEPAMTPFSLGDLGLSDDEIAGLESLNEAPGAAVKDDEPAMTPFSLGDLGLSDDEIAGLESLNEAPGADLISASPQAEIFSGAEPEQDEPTMTPFSLSDLGLSDDEIASLESGATADASAAAEPEEDEPTMAPFSLSDLGLSEDEMASLDSLGAEADTTSERPASGASTSFREEFPPTSPQPSGAAPDESESGDLPIDLQPFSLDELDLNSGPSIGGLGSSLQPFSFDEPPPPRPRVSGFVADEGFEAAPDEPEGTPDTGGFSWQQPTQKPQTSFLKSVRSEPDAEGSIFSKLKQRHTEEGHDRREPEPLPPMPIAEDEHLGLFSMDDVSLRDDVDLPTAAAAALIAAATSEPRPESLEPEPAPEPASEEPHVGHTHAAPLDVENLQEALETGQVQPFSFADLGLSEEEIAAFGLDAAATAEPAAPDELAESAGPTIFEETVESVEPLAPESSAGRGAAYRLDDLEPAESEEIEAAPSAPLAKAEGEDGLPGTGELQPFSLTDLGLSDEEIASLGLDTTAEPEMSVGSELGITEADLEGLGLGDLSWDQPPTAPMPPAPSAPVEAPKETPAEVPMQQTSGDLLVDQLIALGHEQGYVDISDIIAAFEDPEAEAERIEEVGRRLHEAHVEIRDGDEVIDMDAEYAEEDSQELPAEEPAELSASPHEDEPAMTPFSLTDLGLSEDEIAALGLGEPATAAPEPVAETPETTPASQDEPAMTPFSLTDLGLSEDEIAALGLGEPAAVTEEPAVAAPAPEEPAMTPFSLTDLGLSEDEIAALGLGEPAAESGAAIGADSAAVTPEPAPEPEVAPASEPEEPVMTPFSLTDLGLSEAEIAALGLGEVATAPSEPEPAVTPEEPAMTPFSLADLGASEDEIAELDAAEAPAAPVIEEPAAPEPEPVPVPVAPPVPEPVATASVAPPTRPASGRAADGPPSSSGNDVLDAYMRRLEADPQNHMLRLSVARAGGQLGNPDFSIQQYRYLIKQNALLDLVVDDLQDLIEDADERQLQKRLHRTLGDVYAKQGRLDEAMDEYSWTPAGS